MLYQAELHPDARFQGTLLAAYSNIPNPNPDRPDTVQYPIINFGSICIDHVYAVEHFVKPGETLTSDDYSVHPGGKGLNQSIALAAAGQKVIHAGRVGKDGLWLKQLLEKQGVDVGQLVVDDGATGHANIQVTPAGENAIVLYGGANKRITEQDIDQALSTTRPGQFLLLQNETSALAYLIAQAIDRNMRIVLNAAPMSPAIAELPINNLELLIINETEGEALSGHQAPEEILNYLTRRYPKTGVLLTLGSEGAIFARDHARINQAARTVNVVDSTGAGDTFTGYFLANYYNEKAIAECLVRATQAAAISVTREGAASSIPSLKEMDAISY